MVTAAASMPTLPASISRRVKRAKMCIRDSRNALHYQALVKSLNGQYALIESALNDGRR